MTFAYSGISVVDLVSEFIDMVGIDTSIQSEWTDNNNEKIMRYLNRSYWEILNQYNFKINDSAAAFTLNSGSNNIALLSLMTPINTTVIDAIIGVSYVDPITKQSYKLKNITRDDYQLMLNVAPGNVGAPEYYYYEVPGQLQVLPVADKDYTIQVWYTLQLMDLTQSGSYTYNNLIKIPREWHELILYGAVHRALLGLRDYEGAAFIKNMQTSMTNDKVPEIAKENVDNRFSGLSYGKGNGTDNGEFRNRSGYYGRGLWR